MWIIFPVDCQYNRERYRAGDQFLSASGCGPCSCQVDGTMDCSDNCDDTNCLSGYKVLNLIKIFNWFWAQNKQTVWTFEQGKR